MSTPLIDPTPVGATFKITIVVTHTAQGEKLDISTDPPNMYPDSTLAHMLRACDFFSRALQTLDTLQRSAEAVAMQRASENLRRV
jgi:hypothetical protein